VSFAGKKVAFALGFLLTGASAFADVPPLMAEDAEVTLATEAAPPNISGKAGVYVLEKAGYRSVRKSENGFVCIVERTLPNAVEPQCLDSEGVSTFLPRILAVAQLRAQGKSEADIQKAVKDGFASGKFKAPKRPGVDYMLSSHNVVAVNMEKGISVPFPPHLMFYAPNMKNADIGSDGTPGAPVFIVNEGTPHALMIVPAGGGAGHAH
jgi:hypothetical protein